MLHYGWSFPNAEKDRSDMKKTWIGFFMTAALVFSACTGKPAEQSKASEAETVTAAQTSTEEETIPETTHSEAARYLPIRRTVYDYCGNMFSATDYTYNSDFKVKSIGQDSGDIKFVTAYIYDEQGFLIRSEFQDETGTPLLVNIYENDENGRPVFEFYGYPDGRAHNTYRYSYDEAGNLIQKDTFTEGDETKLKERILYTFDDNGHTLTSETQNGEGERTHFYEYIYDEAGVNTEIFYEHNGETQHTIIDYKNGLEEKRRTYADGNMIKITHSEYDDEGNLIMLEDCNGHNEVQFTNVTIYGWVEP